jgi:inhibitor of cysteine peptidase
MKMKKKKVLFILIAVFVLVAVGTGAAIGMSNIKTSSDIIVLRAGKTHDIVLEENPSTGYMWYADENADGVVEIIKDYYVEGLAMPGAPGKHLWRVKALEKGETVLVFKYARPWEENGVIEEKTFKIKVK